MEDGFHRVGDDEARFVRRGNLERHVKLDTSDTPTVTVTRHIRLGPDDGDPRSVFESEVQNLEDAADHITRCGFCGKTRAEVNILIAGTSTYICNECIETCSSIIAENL